MTHLVSLLAMYQHGNGERRRILDAMTDLANTYNLPDLLPRIEHARKAVDHAFDLQHQRLQQTGEAANDIRAAQVDAECDVLVSSIHGVLDAVSHIDVHPHAASCRSVLSALFNPNLRSFVGAKHADQALLNHALVSRMRGENKAMADALSLSPMVDRLAPLADQFSAILRRQTAVITQAEVDAADLAALNATYEVLFWTMGTLRSANPAEDALRLTLLGPVLSADDRLRREKAVKRAIGVQKACEKRRAAEAATKGVSTPESGPAPKVIGAST